MVDLSRCDPDSLAACTSASVLLKTAGFGLVYSSMLSEACYYGQTDHPGVIRVACHRFGRSETRALTMPVLACLTFGSHQGPVTEGQIQHRTALAIGHYVLRRSTHDVPKGEQPEMIDDLRTRLMSRTSAVGSRK